jgi:hypothetical protein
MTNQELGALIKRNPAVVVCGLVSLLLIAGIYFRQGLIPEAEAELAQKAAEGDRYAANIRNSDQLKEQYTDLLAASKEVDARAVRVSQIGSNIQFFYKLESEAGVKLADPSQVTRVAAKGKTVFLPVGFNVSAQGDMAQLLLFLRMLENGTRYTRVVSASLTQSVVNRSAPLALTLNLELLGYP